VDALELTRLPETPPDHGSLNQVTATRDWQRFDLEPTEGDPLSDEEAEEKAYLERSNITKLVRMRSKAPAAKPPKTTQAQQAPEKVVSAAEWLCDDDQKDRQPLFDESQEKDMLALPTAVLRAHAMVYLVKPIVEERARKAQYEVRFMFNASI
jgi:hypothetical protein